MSRQGQSVPTEPGRPVPFRRWPLWLFRVCISAAAVVLFDEAVFAGQFLSGSYGALLTHRTNALIAMLMVVVSAAAGVLLRWPGSGPLWPAGTCLGLAALIGVQINLGFSRALTVHVPLGVAIIGLTALLAGWSWRRKPTQLPAARAAPSKPAREQALAAPSEMAEPAP